MNLLARPSVFSFEPTLYHGNIIARQVQDAMNDEQDTVAVLHDLSWLQQYASVIAQFIRTRYPESSILAFRDRCKDFARWAEQIECQDSSRELRMPLAASDIVDYARALDERNMALSTISTYVSTIGTMHAAAGLYNPTIEPDVKRAMAEIRQKHADDELRRARTLSEAEIESILGGLHHRRRAQGGKMESPETAYKRASVDRALLLTMIEAGMRRSEATRLTWDEVRDESAYDGAVLLRTNWKGRRAMWVTISDLSLQSLRAIKPYDTDGNSRVFNLSRSQITRRLKKMCEEAGINPTDVSGHTPRATLMRLMVEKRAPIDMLERQLRLQTPSIIEGYIDESESASASDWLRQAIRVKTLPS